MWGFLNMAQNCLPYISVSIRIRSKKTRHHVCVKLIGYLHFWFKCFVEKKNTHTSKTDPQNLQIESVKRKLNEAERKKDKCNITPYVRGDSCLSVCQSVRLSFVLDKKLHSLTKEFILEVLLND